MMMPRSVRVRAAADEVPALRVSTKYMETFQMVQPALGGADLTTYLNSAGNLDIYSVGTGLEVYRLRRDEAGHAPYAQEDLNVAAQQLYLWSEGGTSPEHPNILGVDPEGRLSFASFTEAGSYLQRVCEPAKAKEKIRRFLGVRGSTGRVYANVVLDTGVLANNYLEPGELVWGGPEWVPVRGPDDQEVKPKTIAMCANNPVQSALFAIGQKGEVLFSEDSTRAAKMRVLTSSATLAAASELSVVADAKGKLNIFAVQEGSGALWWKKERDYSTGGQMQFEDWVRIDAVSQEPLTRIYACLRFDNLMQVFGVGKDGRLYRTTQSSSDGKKIAWQPIFPLGNSVDNAAFTVGQTAAGYAEAYTVSPTGELRRFWQAPSTLQWLEESVQLPKSDAVVKVPTHAMEITVLDPAGMPKPDAKVTLSAGYLVTLFIDGKSYRVSQVDSVTVPSGADGKVVVHQYAQALAAAPVYAELSGTLSGSPHKLSPNAQLQGRLSALTADEILEAKDASGNPLLPEKYRTREHAESLQQITAASMAIAQQDGGGERVSYRFTSRRRAAFGFHPRADLRALNGTAWEIDLSSGFPQYQVSSVEKVEAWKAERLRQDPGAAELGGFLGIDWGDVWNGIKNGAEWVFNGLKRIVVTIVEGVGQVLFEFAGKVFAAVIEFAQQAFDLVQGVWNWIKVKLEQLFEWLAFLFNIGDFVRSADVVRHTVDTVLNFSTEGVLHVRETILSGIATMKNDLKEVVDRFVDDLNGKHNPTIGAYASENEPDDDDVYQADHNVMLNAFKQNHDRATLRSSLEGAGLKHLQSGADELARKLSQLADNFQFADGKEAFNEAVEYFTAIGSEPDRALELLMSGVIKVLEATALFVVDFAAGVIGLMLELIADMVQVFREILFSEWEIPVLSDIYKLFTGHSLSIKIVDVMAYLVAIPGTLIFKLLTGRAPFPDDGSVRAFEESFNVAYLKSKFGMQLSAHEREDLSRVRGNKDATIVGLSFYSGAMFCRLFVDAATALNSARAGAEPPVPPPYRPKLMTGLTIGLRYLSTAATCPWLLNTDLGAPECGAGKPGFAGYIWTSQVVFGPSRGALIALIMAPGKPRAYTGEITITLWGAANIIMNVWQYCWSPSDKRDPLALSRSLTNIIPGQFLRFLATPDMNQKGKFIPVGIFIVLQSISYAGSIGCAIASAKKAGEGARTTREALELVASTAAIDLANA